jgi:hypothetical protein
VEKGKEDLTLKISLILSLLLIGQAFASDLEDLEKEGYAVVEETQVDGEFEGCDFDKRIQLMNGLVFVCSSYNYSYSYMPDVLILQNIRTKDLKVIIDDEEYDAILYRR